MKKLIYIFVLLLLAPASCKKEKVDEPASSGSTAAAEEGEKAKEDEEKTPKDPAAQMAKAVGQMMKASKALQGTAGGETGGKVVNWRKLGPFLPDELGGFKAERDLNGRTTSMGQMQVSSVKRPYKGGDKRLRVEITDTNLVPMLRTGFAIAASVNEDSSDGVKKGMKIAGSPALLEWRKRGQRGKLQILVAGRYIVKLRLDKTDDPDEVVKLAKEIDLSGLAKVKAE
jgi:hypothetical protein